MHVIEDIPPGAVPARIGDRFTARLGDVGDKHILRVACWQCRRAGAVRPWRLHRRFSPHTRLKDLEAKFRCARCRSLGGTISVYLLPGHD